MEFRVGQKIRIIELADEPNSRYIGKEGVIEKISTDPWHDLRLDGTWGGIGIYPKVDKVEVVE